MDLDLAAGEVVLGLGVLLGGRHEVVANGVGELIDPRKIAGRELN